MPQMVSFAGIIFLFLSLHFTVCPYEIPLLNVMEAGSLTCLWLVAVALAMSWSSRSGMEIVSTMAGVAIGLVIACFVYGLVCPLYPMACCSTQAVTFATHCSFPLWPCKPQVVPRLPTIGRAIATRFCKRCYPDHCSATARRFVAFNPSTWPISQPVRLCVPPAPQHMEREPHAIRARSPQDSAIAMKVLRAKLHSVRRN